MKHKALLDANFNKYHVFSITEYTKEDNWKGYTVVQIAHIDVWKDVWILNGQIDRVVEVGQSSMSGEEYDLWQEYLNG